MADISSRATVELQVNGQQPARVMEDLKKRAAELRKAMDKAAQAGDTKGLRKMQRELGSVERSISSFEDRTRRTERVLNNLGSVSLKELKTTLKTLTAQMNGMARGTKEWDTQAARIRRVREEINRVNRAVGNQTTAWGRAKEMIDKVKMGAIAAMAAVTAAIATANKAVDKYTARQSEEANVRKYTGMSEEDVNTLSGELGKIDTRTSREELLLLAQQAGRLGKQSVDDVLGFVRAADQINVALDDLGEDATLTLSKLTGIFGDEKRLGTEKSLLAVGSVINDLSQNCSASAPYLAEFTSRMGGVGAQSGMTVQQIMAYGAVLDTMNMNVEASSTALSQLLVRIYQEPRKYAQVAGLDVGKFSKLVKTDMNRAVMTLLETLGKAGGMNKLAPLFKDMGENGSNSIKVLAALSGHIEEVRGQQEAANTAFREATSVTNEAAVQNSTAAAALDKQKQAINDVWVELGQRLYPVIVAANNVVLLGMNVILAVVNTVIKFRLVLIPMTAAVVAYTIAVNAAAIKTAALRAITVLHSAAVAAWRVVMLAGAAAVNLFSGNITRATAAWRLFSASIKANPIGLLVAGITAAVAALATYIIKTNQAATVTQTLNNIREEAAVKAVEEKQRTMDLIAASKDMTLSLADRLKAIDELNKIMPGYVTKLNRETGAYVANTKALAEYNAQLVKKYEIEGAKGQLAELGKKKADLVMKKNKKETEAKANRETMEANRRQQAKDPGGNLGGAGTGGRVVSPSTMTAARQGKLESDISDLQDQIDAVIAQEKAITKVYGAAIAKSAVADIPAEVVVDTDGGGGGYSGGRGGNSGGGRSSRNDRLKANKAFKEEVEAQKAAWERDEAANTALRNAGEIGWSEYLSKKHDLLVKYYDDTMKVYENHNLKEDEDYAALLKKKEEENKKWSERKAALAVEDSKRMQRIEETEARVSYATPGSELYDKEEALNIRLHDIRIKYLGKMRAAYDESSEEYHKYSLEIEEAEQEEKLRIQERYAAQYKKFYEAYSMKSAKERMESELAVLDMLHEKGVLKEEEYTKARKDIRASYQDSVLPESSKPDASAKPRSKQYQEDLAAIRKALEEGLITEEEYEKRKQAIRNKYLQNVQGAAGGNEFSDMVINLYNSWAAFFDGTEAKAKNWGQILGNVCASTFAIMNAGLNAYSEFFKAETDAQVAAVEKKYDREKSLAEGNVYLEKRAEKKKKQEVAKIKNEANRKMFAIQVMQAVAQTATNALAAYGSAAAIPVVGHVLAPIAAAMAVAAGAVQIATIKKQQKASEASGYASGGFTPPGNRNTPVGVVHAGEWVAPQSLVTNPATRPMIDLLEQARRSNRMPSLTFGDVSGVITAPMRTAGSVETAKNAPVVVEAPHDPRLADTLDRLSRRLDEPFTTVNTVAGDHGIKRAMDEYDRLMRNKNR